MEQEFTQGLPIFRLQNDSLEVLAVADPKLASSKSNQITSLLRQLKLEPDSPGSWSARGDVFVRSFLYPVNSFPTESQPT